MSSPPLHLPTKTSPQLHTLPPLTEKKEGVGGPGSDPLIIMESPPITSHSLVSGRHPSPPAAGLTVSNSDHCGRSQPSDRLCKLGWGKGRGRGRGRGWGVKESKTDAPQKLVSDAVK